jgi:hypothetical protein
MELAAVEGKMPGPCQCQDAKEEEQRLRHCWDEGLTVVCCFKNDSMICLKEKRKNVKKDLK